MPRSARDARGFGKALTVVGDVCVDAGWDDVAVDVYCAAGALLEKANALEADPW